MPQPNPNPYPCPDPETQKPLNEKATSKCPHCGTVNSVSASQAMNGYTCSGCGQKVSGIAGGSGIYKYVLCPQCNAKGPEVLNGSSAGKRFRCRSCGAEW